MADDAARTQVAAPLGALQSANERLTRALEAVAAGASGIPGDAIEREPVDGLTDAIAALHEVLPRELEGVLAAGAMDSPQVLDASHVGPTTSAKESDAVQAAYVAVGEAAAAAASLFTTGRLMFEGAAGRTLRSGNRRGCTSLGRARVGLIPTRATRLPYHYPLTTRWLPSGPSGCRDRSEIAACSRSR
jgi:hypothetical protein